MSQSITNVIYLMIASIITAMLVSLIFSLSNNAAKSANDVSSTATELTTQLSNYDLDRLNCKYVMGNEAQRIVERYYDECEIILYTANGTSEQTVRVVSDIYDKTKKNFYVKDNSQFYIAVTYDQNDKLEKIKITEK